MEKLRQKESKQPPFSAWPLAFSIGLYVIGGTIALGLPEYFIPQEYYFRNLRLAFIPKAYSTRLILLWTILTIPWLIVAYRQKRSLPTWTLVLPVVTTCLEAIWVRPPHTYDIYIYVCQGRQLLYQANPYKVALFQSMHDRLIAGMNQEWFGQVSMYGPLLLILGFLINAMAPNLGLLGLGRLMKAVWLLPQALWAKLFWHHWRRHRERNLLLLAVFANPVMVFQAFVEGHLDVAMTACLCGTGYFLQAKKPKLAALVLLAGANIKMTCLIAFPIGFSWLFFKSRRHALQFLLFFSAGYFLSHAFIGGGDLTNAIEFNYSWTNVAAAGILPRVLFWMGVVNTTLMHKICSGVFYVSIILISLLLLKGHLAESPYFAMGLAFAIMCLTQVHIRYWYYLVFWALFWMSTQNLEYILISISLWSITTLFAMYAEYFRFEPYLTAALLATDITFRYRLCTLKQSVLPLPPPCNESTLKS